ncbi:MAG: alpha-glucan family phosphorylase [Candidatus Binatia bacterium]|nr:alpha-glucan family phosphorylase [Candidatus Binatia bacterium]
MVESTRWDGQRDVRAAIADLEERLPESLRDLAWLAMNYRWSWHPDGPGLFATIDAELWETLKENPRDLLCLAPRARLRALAQDPAFVQRLAAVAEACRKDFLRPSYPGIPTDQPVAYFCAEFGFHPSVPIYSGGLGVLAGDILKTASDLALPMVGVGIFYRQGYFHQRLDSWGWQHEYWIDLSFRRLPTVLVTGQDEKPILVSVPINGRTVFARIWRIDVGRTPLYLLDTDHDANEPIDRWITSRLYVADRMIRLAQYAILGIGGVRALDAMGITPSVIHLNEGHAALATFERLRQRLERGKPLDAALAEVRSQAVFTTHTPVPAGNEGYHEQEWGAVLGSYLDRLGIPRQTFFDFGRVAPGNPHEAVNITPLALRTTKLAIGVSRKHGGVSRALWHPLWPDRTVEEVPIRHVTNGVHVPTWMGPEMQSLFRRHLGEQWLEHLHEPNFLERLATIPDEELWSARNAQRKYLVDYVRAKSVRDRLSRGEQADYTRAAWETFSPDSLTIGFARRVAGYKRFYLLARLTENGILQTLENAHTPFQLVLAGKAHPADHEAKEDLRNRFQLKHSPEISKRVVFLEDYDLAIARVLTWGVDLWLNLPRPPLEASGTSGMKVALNGGLNLSVLDGWWDEAFDGENGWGIRSPEADPHTQDEHDTRVLAELLQHEVIPLFYERDATGLPRRWLAKVKRSLRTLVGHFSANRMLREYVALLYT